jgi:hypothetical protein
MSTSSSKITHPHYSHVFGMVSQIPGGYRIVFQCKCDNTSEVRVCCQHRVNQAFTTYIASHMQCANLALLKDRP